MNDNQAVREFKNYVIDSLDSRAKMLLEAVIAELEAAEQHVKIVREQWEQGAKEFNTRLEAVTKEQEQLIKALSYVAWQRLPLGDQVFDHLPKHWKLEVTQLLSKPL